ncbi:hypothetical protein [Poritiphilus flavus]|uniref:Uncharacterized protein n=1 Tax=Poritiphilus flavus TaxID=2697053 RepID=A0A6L9EI55_9FLAO|nr:hypothetical protein [Poritiphilus flavus]NAS14335.1 hypothetical protein [Poritiphilus flavus]
MSRLYYEKVTIPTRNPIVAADSDEPEVSNNQDIKGYLEKVSSLIPAEVIAGYLTMFGFVPLIDETTQGILSKNETTVAWIVFFFCFLLTPIYLNYQAEKGKPKQIHLIISSVAFVIWSYVTTGASLIPDYYNAALGSIFLVAFSLISGFVKLNK